MLLPTTRHPSEENGPRRPTRRPTASSRRWWGASRPTTARRRPVGTDRACRDGSKMRGSASGGRTTDLPTTLNWPATEGPASRSSTCGTRVDLSMALASDQWIIERVNDVTAALWSLTQHAIRPRRRGVAHASPLVADSGHAAQSRCGGDDARRLDAAATTRCGSTVRVVRAAMARLFDFDLHYTTADRNRLD